MNIKFPTCWDGVNAEAKDGVKHVVYATECDGKEHNDDEVGLMISLELNHCASLSSLGSLEYRNCSNLMTETPGSEKINMVTKMSSHWSFL